MFFFYEGVFIYTLLTDLLSWHRRQSAFRWAPLMVTSGEGIPTTDMKGFSVFQMNTKKSYSI